MAPPKSILAVNFTSYRSDAKHNGTPSPHWKQTNKQTTHNLSRYYSYLTITMTTTITLQGTWPNGIFQRASTRPGTDFPTRPGRLLSQSEGQWSDTMLLLLLLQSDWSVFPIRVTVRDVLRYSRSWVITPSVTVQAWTQAMERDWSNPSARTVGPKAEMLWGTNRKLDSRSPVRRRIKNWWVGGPWNHHSRSGARILSIASASRLFKASYRAVTTPLFLESSRISSANASSWWLEGRRNAANLRLRFERGEEGKVVGNGKMGRGYLYTVLEGWFGDLAKGDEGRIGNGLCAWGLRGGEWMGLVGHQWNLERSGLGIEPNWVRLEDLSIYKHIPSLLSWPILPLLFDLFIYLLSYVIFILLSLTLFNCLVREFFFNLKLFVIL